MSKRFVFTIITLVAIAISATIAIFLAKGYRFSPQEKRIVGTGIIDFSLTQDVLTMYI